VIAEAQLREHFESVRRLRDGDWLVTCPAHDDRKPSLHVTRGRNRWLLKCHAGCDLGDVLEQAGLTRADLFEDSNGHREIEAIYRYTDERGRPLFEVVRFEGKEFRQRRPDGSWGLGDTKRVLYRLPRVVEAVETGKEVWILEGEKDVHALEKLDLVATCNPMGAGKWRADYSQALRGAKVTIVADADEAGRQHAGTVAASLEEVVGELRVLEPTLGKDISDHLAAGGRLDELRFMPFAPLPSDEKQSEASFAAPMSKKLAGIPPEPGVEMTRISPNGEVKLDDVLDAVANHIKQYVVLSEAQLRAITLWVAHTWVLDAFDVTPYMWITSAERESGKTLLLEVLENLVAKPWLTGRVTAAVLPRKVEKVQPTLLLDETDNAFKADHEYSANLLGVLNTGYKRSGHTSCCVGNNNDFKDYATFCAKAIAGIGRMPDTLESRCIMVALKRKLPNEKVKRFRYRRVKDEAKPIRVLLGGLAQLAEELDNAEPELPELPRDRALDFWEPLLAIAERAGGAWPEKAREAARTLSKVDEDEEKSVGVAMLRDTRRVFHESALPTREIVNRLNELEEAPWGGWNDGTGLKPRQYTARMRRFGLRTRNSVNYGDKRLSGYLREHFVDVWARYLPDEEPEDEAGGPSEAERTDPAPTPEETPTSPTTPTSGTHEVGEVGVGRGFSRGMDAPTCDAGAEPHGGRSGHRDQGNGGLSAEEYRRRIEARDRGEEW
jgi:Protein of unknown function (DUF3631)